MDIKKIKKILIVRTDRIGDVVLSTPVIAAARKAFPEAYIAVMVSPLTTEIVNGNPNINEVIVFDKEKKHRRLPEMLNFARRIRNMRFDLALILHSTNRVNIICFLAGIPARVGYARGKLDFLLTDKIRYTKRLGEKHESEYSMDLLRYLGVEAEDSPLFMPIKGKDEMSIDALLKADGLKSDEKIVVLHPGASCISKMWSAQNFAETADKLTERFAVRTVLVSSSEQVDIGKKVKELMKHEPIFLCGRTSLGELTALFKRTSLFISNDSGPVHIACAVGTPVISIFGRNEKGLSPARWRPLGHKSIAIHKDVGCVECLAHNCKKGFLCLKSVTVDEILEKATRFL